jgi:hypothetical protein
MRITQWFDVVYKTEVSSLYGRETWNNFRLLENLRIKINRRVVDLVFLKQCGGGSTDQSLDQTFTPFDI